MVDPVITPLVISSLVNAATSLLNGSENREQSTELAKNNQAYQQHQQEIQLLQLELSYLNHLQQCKHQATQIDEAKLNREQQKEYAQLNQQQQAEFEKFRLQAQHKISERNLQFQAWRLRKEQELQRELAVHGRKTQQMVAAFQRETARQQLEFNKLYENWPLRMAIVQILNEQPRYGNPPLKVIIAPPEVDYDKFGANTTNVPKLEKSLAEGLRQFFNQYYPSNSTETPVEFLDGAWDSKRFHGGSSIKALHGVLSSEPILILESEIDGDYLNLRFAYWAAGQTRYIYESVISRFRYRDLVYAFAKERAQKWKTGYDLLIKQGKNPAIYNETDTHNLKVLEEEQQLAKLIDISQLQPRYKLRSDDFEAINQFLVQQHCLVAGLIADMHYITQYNQPPNFPAWLHNITNTNTLTNAPDFVLEIYRKTFDHISLRNPILANELSLILSFKLAEHDNVTWSIFFLRKAITFLTSILREEHVSQDDLINQLPHIYLNAGMVAPKEKLIYILNRAGMDQLALRISNELTPATTDNETDLTFINIFN